MAYDLYVLNQRLPRFPLKDGYSDGQSLQNAVGKTFAAWLNETVIGNVQRRRACSQIFEFSVWMEQKKRVLESVAQKDFAEFLLESNAQELCRFKDFLRVARTRLPSLAWSSESGPSPS